MAKRFFYNGKINSSVILDGDEYNHLAHTMRAKVGDAVILFNGDGKNYCGVINLIDKRFAEINITETIPNPAETEISLTLFQAVPVKTEKLEIIIQKLTELGAERIVPVITGFSNHRRESVKTERLNKIALEACKQCGRSKVLKVEDVTEFSQIIERLKDFDLVIMPYENEQNGSLRECLAINSESKKIALIIGAEGGFSQDEVEQCQNSGVHVVTLGSRILRSETAAIAATSVLMYSFSEWERRE